MGGKVPTREQKEYIAELLKERIYATLALLAVLIGIDASHSTPLHAELLIIGTIVSLWAASIVSSIMSRRLIFTGELDEDQERELQLRKHAPMLAVLPFTTLMVGLSMLGLISLTLAINISIVSLLLLLVVWSVVSARSLRVKKMPIFVIAAIELLIGLAVVALKIVVGH